MTRKGVVPIGGRTLWRTALSRWDEITAPDLHETYGLDDADPAFWERPWRNTLNRIRGLLGNPHTRLVNTLAPPKE